VHVRIRSLPRRPNPVDRLGSRLAVLPPLAGLVIVDVRLVTTVLLAAAWPGSLRDRLILGFAGGIWTNLFVVLWLFALREQRDAQRVMEKHHESGGGPPAQGRRVRGTRHGRQVRPCELPEGAGAACRSDLVRARLREPAYGRFSAYRLRGDTVTTVGPMVELTLSFSAAAGGSWFSASAGASGRWTSALFAR
jgi:hypothetical protein